MKYLSVCSGIEAATVAWHPLDWEPVAFGEIEKFPCQVLAHHYPNTPNWGDMTKFKEWPDANVNVLVGGTPCQSFSVAGLRKGLDDPRGNLMLTYLAIAAKYRPQWLVWENVPGVLSSNGGHDFASLLRGMGECGYGFAYRVLDAQYFGVAQRRRRVFVVGYFGDWQPAAAVLFERHSLSGHPAPSREKGQKTPSPTGASLDVSCIGTLTAGFGKVGAPEVDAYTCIPAAQPIANTLTASRSSAQCPNEDTTLVTQPIPIDSMNHIGRGDKHSMGDFVAGAPSYTLTKNHSHAVAQPIPFDTTQITSPQNGNNPQAGDPCHPLAATAHVPAIAQPISIHPHCIGRAPDAGPQGKEYLTDGSAYCMDSRGQPQAVATHDVAGTMLSRNTSGGFSNSIDHAAAGYMAIQQMAVRRLTPVECERLQGFPDNYTDIKPKGKATPDGPRYKALGNSMAVPVMAWIGSRIQKVQNILDTRENP